MENKKKINVLLIILGTFLCISYSCNNKDVFLNELKKNIKKPSKLVKIKYNLYEDENKKIYFLSDAIFQNLGKSEEIINKKEGIILQDSLYDSSNKLIPLKKIIDLNSYIELDKDIFYKDKSNVYMNRGSQYSSYPFFLTDFKSKDFYLFKEGNYFKYNLNIYTYGYFGYVKLENVNVTKFIVKSIKTLNNSTLILGFDQIYIYDKSEKLNFNNFMEIPLNEVSKDSLIIKYFNYGNN